MPHPDGWEVYSCFNKVIEGTRIICFKVPLKLTLQSKIPDDDKFSPSTLIEKLQAEGKTLGIVIDLTFTTKYYDKTDFVKNDITYEKIFTRGKEVPDDRVYMSFASAIDAFLEKNSDNDHLIGVHCTHGLNRTGYMVCRYMIEKLNCQPPDAITAFNVARGHNIERENYLDDLKERKVGEVTDCESYDGAGLYNTIRVKQSESARRFHERQKARFKHKKRVKRNTDDDGEGYHSTRRRNSYRKDKCLPYNSNDEDSPPYSRGRNSHRNNHRGFGRSDRYSPPRNQQDFRGNDRWNSYDNNHQGYHGNIRNSFDNNQQGFRGNDRHSPPRNDQHGFHGNHGWGSYDNNQQGSRGNDGWPFPHNNQWGFHENDGFSSHGNNPLNSHGNGPWMAPGNQFQGNREPWHPNNPSNVDSSNYWTYQANNQWGYQSNNAWGYQSNNPVGNNTVDFQYNNPLGYQSYQSHNPGSGHQVENKTNQQQFP